MNAEPKVIDEHLVFEIHATPEEVAELRSVCSTKQWQEFQKTVSLILNPLPNCVGWTGIGVYMGAERQAGGPVTESNYELPTYCEAVEAVLRCKKESVQESLDALAAQGYYLVRRKKS